MSPGKPQDCQNKAREAPGERHLRFQGPKGDPLCVRAKRRFGPKTSFFSMFFAFRPAGGRWEGGRGDGKPSPN